MPHLRRATARHSDAISEGSAALAQLKKNEKSDANRSGLSSRWFV